MSLLTQDALSKLSETRDRWSVTRFRWGVTDCDLSVADHVLRVTGIDPAAAWRGVYRSSAEAEAFIAEAGGNLELVRQGMEGAGFRPVDPVPGAVIVAAMDSGQVAGLATPRGGMFKALRGVYEAPCYVLGAWA